VLVISDHQRRCEATALEMQPHKREADQNTTTEPHALVVGRYSKSPIPPLTASPLTTASCWRLVCLTTLVRTKPSDVYYRVRGHEDFKLFARLIRK